MMTAVPSYEQQRSWNGIKTGQIYVVYLSDSCLSKSKVSKVSQKVSNSQASSTFTWEEKLLLRENNARSFGFVFRVWCSRGHTWLLARPRNPSSDWEPRYFEGHPRGLQESHRFFSLCTYLLLLSCQNLDEEKGFILSHLACASLFSLESQHPK